MTLPDGRARQVCAQPREVYLRARLLRRLMLLGMAALGAGVWRSLDDAQDGLARIAKDFEVRAFTFDGKTHPAAVENGRVRLSETPSAGACSARLCSRPCR
ncbi:hypothetical protein LCGC14_3109520 [marine sediment metagenome]|uniref:Uncharacterized protein n=1 Tax=marine sediment metagenome TaxID=412755 RepID=A0A0F8YVE9_9ZZZZ